MKAIDLRDPGLYKTPVSPGHKLFSYRDGLMLAQPVGYANAVHRNAERAINEATVRVRRARQRPTDLWPLWPLQRNR